MYIFLIIPVLYLIFGIVILIFAVSWPTQPGKRLFVTYIALINIVLPLLLLFSVFVGTTAYGSGYRYRRSVEMMQYSLTAISALTILASSVTLFLYTLFKSIDQSNMPKIIDAKLAKPPTQWVMTQTSGQRILTLRKREWALLIDHIPLFVAWACFGIGSNIGRDLPVVWSALVFLITLLHIAQLVYLLLKDASYGRSFGKRMTGCRVVNMKNGIPIGVALSAARNFVFLIPGFAFIELLVASFRSDRRRLGDLIAGTVVVPEHGDSDLTVSEKPDRVDAPKPHPLDD